MDLTADLPDLLAATARLPFLQFGVIVGATFILEDAASVLTAIAASEGLVSVPLGILSLIVGIAGGDVALYGLGRLAATHPWARSLVAKPRVDALRRLLGRNVFAAVLAARFVPGTRFATYTACGFLSLSLTQFALGAVAASLGWVLLLFTAAYHFGAATASLLGIWRWPIGLALGLVPFASLYFSRHSLSRGRRIDREAD